MDHQEASYLVVMPKFSPKSPNRPYIAVLTQKPTDYEEQFKDSDFYIASPVFFGSDVVDEKKLLGVLAAQLASARLSGVKVADLAPAYQAAYARYPHAENFMTPEVFRSKTGRGQGPADPVHLHRCGRLTSVPSGSKSSDHGARGRQYATRPSHSARGERSSDDVCPRQARRTLPACRQGDPGGRP